MNITSVDDVVVTVFFLNIFFVWFISNCFNNQVISFSRDDLIISSCHVVWWYFYFDDIINSVWYALRKVCSVFNFLLWPFYPLNVIRIFYFDNIIISRRCSLWYTVEWDDIVLLWPYYRVRVMFSMVYSRVGWYCFTMTLLSCQGDVLYGIQ